MTRSRASIWLVAAASLGFGVAGCADASVGASRTPTVAASAAPHTVAPPTVAPATTAPEPTMTPDPPAASLGEPPEAMLATEGGDPVAGSLGSFTWGDGGSDSPWLPGASITVGAGESLTVRLPDDAPVQDWVAKRVAAGTLDGAGAISLANGAAAPITFRAPAPGAWSVQVDVTFGDDLGSAAYYWAVTVR